MPNRGRCSQTRLRDKEALLGLRVLGAELFDEAVHRSSDTSQLFHDIRLHGRSSGCLRRIALHSVVKIDKHDFFLVCLLDFRLCKAVELLEFAYGAASLLVLFDGGLLGCIEALLLLVIFVVVASLGPARIRTFHRTTLAALIASAPATRLFFNFAIFFLLQL